MTYEDQNKEIQNLLKSIGEKSKSFARENHNSIYYEDLKRVIYQLQETNKCLK